MGRIFHFILSLLLDGTAHAKQIGHCWIANTIHPSIHPSITHSSYLLLLLLLLIYLLLLTYLMGIKV